MSQIDLSLKPAQTEIILQPNSSFTQAYEVVNSSSQTVRLSTSVESWLPTDNEGHLSYTNTLDTNLNFSLLNSGLNLNQDFLLNPGQKKQLVLSITSTNSLERDNYLTFFITQKPLNETDSPPQNLARLGSHLLITTSQQENSSANLTFLNLQLKPKIKDIFLPLKITGEIYNPENYFTRINGQIIITRNGQEISRQDIYPYTILANHSRLLSCPNQQQEPAPCSLSAPLWPGHYQIEIDLNSSTPPLQFKNDFFILPYSIIITIVLLFSFLFLLLRKQHSVSSNRSK